jgi:ABC-type multidrug transport system fused ATPase/permease subunit
MRSQVRLAFSAIWPFRVPAAASIALQMASVAAESVALLALGSLFILSMENESTDELSGVLNLPEKILSALELDLTTTSIFLFILVLLLIKAIMQSGAIFIANIVWTGFQRRHVDELAEAYASADWNYLAKQRSSTMLNLMFPEVSRAAGTIGALLTFTTATLSATVYLFFAIRVSPLAVGIFLLSFAVLVLILLPILRLIRKLAGELIDIRKELTQKVAELLSGVKVMKALGSEERVHKQISDDSTRMRRLLLHVGFLRDLTSSTDLGVIVAVMGLFILHLTGLEQALSAGVIGVILLRMSQRTQAAIATIGPIVEGLPSLETTHKTLGTLRKHREKDGHTVPNEHLSSLRFKKVSYNYDDRADVLTELDFEVLSGEFIGIVGESGAGKTTLVDLVLGLLNPKSGHVVVDGLDLSELQRVAWRRRLGYVPQDVNLFHDTIYNNITAYRPEVTEADVLWAANIAQASEFIEGFELGYDHIVGDRGIRLSGGQRQRLALARALATHPSFLLLDEATSSLDGHAEHEFQSALENVRSQMTIIAIAHRIPTVMGANRVIVVSEGKIVENGPPLELLKIPGGRFAKLYAIQYAAATEATSAPGNESRNDENQSQ